MAKKKTTKKKVAKKKVAKKKAAKKKVAKKKATKKVAKKKKTAKKKAAKKVTKKKTAKKVAKKKTVKKTEAKQPSLPLKKEAKKTKAKTTKKADKENQPDLPLEGKIEQKVADVEKDSSPQKLKEEIGEVIQEHGLDAIMASMFSLDFFSFTTDECTEKGCDNPATTGPFCRLHYIKNWKQIKKKESILVSGKLQNIIAGIVQKYPIRYIEALLKDLMDEKSFFNTLKELNIDAGDEDSFDGEDELSGDDDQDIAFETKAGVKSYSEE